MGPRTFFQVGFPSDQVVHDGATDEGVVGCLRITAHQVREVQQNEVFKLRTIPLLRKVKISCDI